MVLLFSHGRATHSGCSLQPDPGNLLWYSSSGYPLEPVLGTGSECLTLGLMRGGSAPLECPSSGLMRGGATASGCPMEPAWTPFWGDPPHPKRACPFWLPLETLPGLPFRFALHGLQDRKAHPLEVHLGACHGHHFRMALLSHSEANPSECHLKPALGNPLWCTSSPEEGVTPLGCTLKPAPGTPSECLSSPVEWPPLRGAHWSMPQAPFWATLPHAF